MENKSYTDLYPENKAYIRFEERGDSWKATKLPHYAKWISLMLFFRRRGFVFSTPQYYLEQKHQQANHKTGIKNGVAVCLELCGSQINVEFGGVKNIWENWGCNLWDSSDSRHKPLNYLELIAVKTEYAKFQKFIATWGEVIDKNEKNKTVEQLIVDNLKNNNHIHGVVTCLQDIKVSIESGAGKHNQGSNSRDKNGKQIICGDVKYFYHWKTKRLHRGVVWHHINSMWWVIVNGKRENLSAHDLFDYDDTLPKRKMLNPEQQINRLTSVLKHFESIRDYNRCIKIDKQINALKSGNSYHVFSLKWNKWWGPNNNGYTDDKAKAGIYFEKTIQHHQSYYNNGTTTKAIIIT